MAADDAILVRVADAITSLLNNHDFGVEFEAIRSYADWDEKLEDLGSLHVDVVPVLHDEAGLHTRGKVGYLMSFDVGIRKRFEQSEQESATGKVAIAEIDRMVKLVEQFHEFFCTDENRRITGDNIDAVWQSAKVRTTYARKHLRENRQFTGLLRVSYRATKRLEVA